MKRDVTDRRLLVLLAAYCGASLFHFAHNAVFLGEYPNMPAWLTPVRVMVAWFGVTAIGIAGWLLYRAGYRVAGLVALAAYGALGLDGLGHYRLAPPAAHSFTMNLTIGLEGIVGTVVAGVSGWILRVEHGRRSSAA